MHWITTTEIMVQGLTIYPHDSSQPTLSSRTRYRSPQYVTLGFSLLVVYRNSRTRARCSHSSRQFLVGLSNVLSIAALALVYGTVFKVQDFNTYVVYLGIGLVVWNGISSAIGSAPNLFEHNQAQVHNTNLNPIFYVLEEWAFQIQTFLQSFSLVAIALSWFRHDLLLNLFFMACLF